MKIYLAIPYTGNENRSFRVANLVAGMLMQQGHIIYSPVSHTHPIAVECDLPKDWEYWKQYGEAFIGFCDELYIVKLTGWELSKGVNAEIEIAKSTGKPIRYIEYYEQCRNQIEIEFPIMEGRNHA